MIRSRKISRSHKVLLKPTEQDEIAFSKASGVARLAWNWCVAESIKDDEEYKKTNAKPRSPNQLKKEFNAVKHELFPWMDESPKDANQQPFAYYSKAKSRYIKYMMSLKTGKPTRKVGKPRFKCKGTGDSFYCSNDKVNVKVGSDMIRLPVIGWVKMAEKFKPINTHLLKINSVVVSKDANDWYASISYEYSTELVDVLNPDDKRPVAVLDMGIRTFATILDSDGVLTEIDVNTEKRKKHAKKVAKLQRKISRCATSPTKCRNKRHQNKRKAHRKLVNKNLKISKTERLKIIRENELKKGMPDAQLQAVPKLMSKKHYKLEMRLKKVHAKHRAQRDDALHKLSRTLCRNNQAIGIEDLNITGWMANKNWASIVADLGIRKFFTMLAYKAVQEGTRLHMFSRWFPSSKTCNHCKNVHSELGLEKLWICPSCGCNHHRDINAVLVMLSQLIKDLELKGFEWLLGSPELTLKTNCEAGGSTASAKVSDWLTPFSFANSEVVIQIPERELICGSK